MSRRAVAVLAIVIALIGGRLILNRGMHGVRAARAGTSSPAPDAAQPVTQPIASVPAAAVAGGSGKESSAADPVRSSGTPAAPSTALAQDGVTDVDPHKAFGSKSAPVVMEEFSDYQCPSCKAFYASTNRQLMDNYVSTGKVYLIHRDFPLAMHAYSRVAARYARAAGELGKIEPAEKVLFDNQEKWEQTGDVDGIFASVFTPAEMAKIRALVKGGTLDPLIEKDYQIGMTYRVNQTPTTVFHCKGQTYPYAGGMSYEILRTFLDQLLSQK